MDLKTITIELTAKQMEAVKNLEERGLTIGDALERLVEIQDAALKTGDDLLNNKINEAEEKKLSLEKALSMATEELNILNKLKDTSLDFKEKQAIFENEYANIGDDYQSKVQQLKQNTKHFSFLKR